MPKLIADFHNDIMKEFFNRGKSDLIGGAERVVYPINSDGYIVPCNLMVKVLP